MRIAVLCGNLPYYDVLAFYTIQVNKREYCLRHGYHLETIHSIRPKFNDPSSHAGGFTWSRLEHMAEMVESGKYDWVWVVGADTLITNLTIKLEDIIAEAMTPDAKKAPLPVCPYFPDSPAPQTVIHWKPGENHKNYGEKHLLICGERVTPMQADSFLVRGSREGSIYLRDILDQYKHYKHHAWVENQAMIDLRDKHAAITYMVPQWKMNCVDYSRWYDLRPQYKDNNDCFGNRGNWEPGDFLIHWPASGRDERMIFLEYYWQKIVK